MKKKDMEKGLMLTVEMVVKVFEELDDRLLIIAKKLDDMSALHQRLSKDVKQQVAADIQGYRSEVAGLAGKIDVIFRESKRPPPERG